MRPHEFFDLTPGEVARWLGPNWRGHIEKAYWTETIRRRKRLPSKVAELFPREREVLSDDQMLARMKSVVAEFNRRQAATSSPSPSPSKKKSGK